MQSLNGNLIMVTRHPPPSSQRFSLKMVLKVVAVPNPSPKMDCRKIYNTSLKPHMAGSKFPQNINSFQTTHTN
jgi:hypothetical protein